MLALFAALCLLLQPIPTPIPTPTPPTQLSRFTESQQRQITLAARDYRRLSDGSLWSRRLERERDTTHPLAGPLADPSAPFWYCPENDRRFPTLAAVYARLDEEDIRAQLPEDSVYLPAPTLYQQGPEGLIVRREGVDADDYLITPLPRESYTDGQTLPPFAGTRIGIDYVYARHARGGVVEVRVLRLQRLMIPEPRLPHTIAPVTPEELAAALASGKLPGLADLRPRKTGGTWLFERTVTKMTPAPLTSCSVPSAPPTPAPTRSPAAR